MIITRTLFVLSLYDNFPVTLARGGRPFLPVLPGETKSRVNWRRKLETELLNMLMQRETPYLFTVTPPLFLPFFSLSFLLSLSLPPPSSPTKATSLTRWQRSSSYKFTLRLVESDAFRVHFPGLFYYFFFSSSRHEIENSRFGRKSNLIRMYDSSDWYNNSRATRYPRSLSK